MAVEPANPKVGKHTLTWDEYYLTIKALSAQIPVGKYKNIYGIPRGGLVIAVCLSHLLNIPLTMFIHDAKTLIVDDVSDSGKTLKLYCRLENSYDKFTYDSATLHRKDGTIWEPTYCVATINEWIVYPYEK